MSEALVQGGILENKTAIQLQSVGTALYSAPKAEV